MSLEGGFSYLRGDVWEIKTHVIERVKPKVTIRASGSVQIESKLTEAQMECVFGTQCNFSLNTRGLRVIETAVVTLLQPLYAAAKLMF